MQRNKEKAMKITVTEQLEKEQSSQQRFRANIEVDGSFIWSGFGSTKEQAIGDAIIKNLDYIAVIIIDKIEP